MFFEKFCKTLKKCIFLFFIIKFVILKKSKCVVVNIYNIYILFNYLLDILSLKILFNDLSVH